MDDSAAIDAVTERGTPSQFRPTGTRLTVPSSLTGALLTYFCPHPLRTLVADTLLRDDAGVIAPPFDAGLGMLLVRYLLRHGMLPAQGSPHGGFEPFLRPRTLRSSEDFMALASAVFGRPQRFREAISFAGGTSPSTATAIYPPHQEIARLFAELPAFFNEDWTGYAAIDVVSLVFYYALTMHPFANGNGRWARQVAIAAAARAGSVWCATVPLILLANRETQLIDSWRNAQDQGLSAYLQMCRTAYCRLLNCVGASPASSLLLSMHARLKARYGLRDAGRVYAALLADGAIDAAGLMTLLGCSRKKAQGVLDALLESADDASMFDAEKIVLRNVVDAALSELETLGLE